MPVPGNGTWSRIIGGIVVGLTLLLIGMVLAAERRISVLEAQVTVGLENRMKNIEASIETNRKENREEHQNIGAKLDAIQREVVKK